ncbi:DUF456 domain-containing protein [Desulfovibrio mangrovi]|uniref:DUF456 domain-containing protein n=1 Tax=Desulfovibrio mangrovi TaxID=2976983 RepID=UPI0022477648|nr:DUF456 domain-containing protein [Desulfovibrio mangrovi]UZP65970.1 DUF456 domain-containing protein [Desulfovibrio mangrovi]
MELFIGSLFILFMALSLGLHIFSLPGNWLVLGLLGLWRFIHPEAEGMDTTFFLIAGGLALLGEVLEFGVQVLGAKRYGGSNKGNVGGIIGAIAGAILGAPFFLGLGALVGALAGAYAGCLLLEIGQGRSFDVARHAAKGAFFGKFLGLGIKFGIGVCLVMLGASHIWA